MSIIKNTPPCPNLDNVPDIDETEILESADEDNSCSVCLGTGIGQSGDPDTSRCSACSGRGYSKPSRDEEYEPEDNL